MESFTNCKTRLSSGFLMPWSRPWRAQPPERCRCAAKGSRPAAVKKLVASVRPWYGKHLLGATTNILGASHPARKTAVESKIRWFRNLVKKNRLHVCPTNDNFTIWDMAADHFRTFFDDMREGDVDLRIFGNDRDV